MITAFFSFFLFFPLSLFFSLNLSLLQYHSFWLPGYHLCTPRESTREERGPETRTQVKRGASCNNKGLFKPQEHKSKWGKRNPLPELKTDKHKNVIEKGWRERRRLIFPSDSNSSRMHVSYLDCLVKDTHLLQIRDKSPTAGQSSLWQYGPRRYYNSSAMGQITYKQKPDLRHPTGHSLDSSD